MNAAVRGAHRAQPRRVVDQGQHRRGQLRAVELLDDAVRRSFCVCSYSTTAPPRRGERAGVHHLVLAGQVDLRHDDGRQAERRHLVQRAGARREPRPGPQARRRARCRGSTAARRRTSRSPAARRPSSAAACGPALPAERRSVPSPRRSPVPWMTKRRSRCGSSAPSASTSARLIVRAPCDPPKANTTCRPGGTAKSSAARAASRSTLVIRRRSGYPAITAVPPNAASVSGNDTNTRSARRPTSRFSLPGAAFCSWTYDLRAGTVRHAAGGPRRTWSAPTRTRRCRR